MAPLAGRVRVHEVEGRLAWRRFHSVPPKVAARHPQALPTWRKLVDDSLAEQAAGVSSGDSMAWVVTHGGRPVARAAGLIKAAPLTARDLPAGPILAVGFFSCLDRPDAADALFDAMFRWGRARGAVAAMGPMSFRPHVDECGVLIEGFDQPALSGVPGSPPYYADLWRDAGWLPEATLLGYRIELDQPVPPRVARLARVCRERRGIEVRSIRRAEYLPLLRQFLRPDGPWGHVWGFEQLSDGEIEVMAAQLDLIAGRLGLVAEVERTEEPVGIVLTIADLSQAMELGRTSRQTRRGQRHFLQRLGAIDRLRIMSVGVEPAYERYGVGAVLYDGLLARATRRPNTRYLELSQLWADNAAAVRLTSQFGLNPYKRWQVYVRRLSSEQPS
jgi:GNAT superfamily N-acetyltransferase